jgi:hypothetical protein
MVSMRPFVVLALAFTLCATARVLEPQPTMHGAEVADAQPARPKPSRFATKIEPSAAYKPLM